MRNHINRNTSLFVIVLYLFVFPKPVYAYVDPGSGSYFFQIILAALLGGTIGVKGIRQKISAIVKKIFTKPQSEKGKNNS